MQSILLNSDFEELANLLDLLRANRKQKINDLYNYLSVTENMYRELYLLLDCLKDNIDNLQDTVGSINNCDMNLVTTEKEDIDTFYDSLPDALKEHLSAEDFVRTDDGFVMCTKSMADVLQSMNIKDTSITDKKEDVPLYFDDWYIYAIEGEGGYVYSLLKMRELENDSGDSNDPGVTISFTSFDINTMSDLAEENSDENMKKFVEEYNEVTYDADKSRKHDDTLQQYFSKSESDAPYIVVNHYIESIIAPTCANGKIVLSDNVKNAPERVTDALEQINQEAGYTIYDKENNCLYIGDSTELSEYEKYAILASFTANVNYNSFAAEVEFHSDALVDWKCNIPYLGKEKWYSSAIHADMAIGEEIESNQFGAFDEYYDLESNIVQQQEKNHGKQ